MKKTHENTPFITSSGGLALAAHSIIITEAPAATGGAHHSQNVALGGPSHIGDAAQAGVEDFTRAIVIPAAQLIITVLKMVVCHSICGK